MAWTETDDIELQESLDRLYSKQQELQSQLSPLVIIINNTKQIQSREIKSYTQNREIKITKIIIKDPHPNIVEYYDIIRELISVILLLDGYKTYGEGAHKKLIEYLQTNCKEFNEYEILLIDDLRIIRNKIAYDGFFVNKDYIERKMEDIQKIIGKLKEIIRKK